jgi:hypothetical protein
MIYALVRSLRGAAGFLPAAGENGGLMRGRNWSKWALALASSIIVLSATPVASSASASGPTVVLPKYGLSVTLPSGWQKVTLTQAGVDKIAKYLKSTSPTLYQQFVNNESTVRHLQLYAIGPPEGASLPNLNILVESPQGLPSGESFLTQAQPVMKSELQQAGFKNVTISVVHLPLGPALQGVYTLPGSSVTLTQLYISHKGHLYIVSMSPASVVPQIESKWRWR